MLDLSDIAIDAESAENGKEIPFHNTGAVFLIARFSNDEAEALRSQLTLEYWDELTSEDKKAATAADKKLKVKVLATKVLKGWSGIGEAGVEMEYSEETAEKVIGDPKYSDIRRFVERASMDPSNWRQKKEEEATEVVKSTAVS